MSDGNLFERAGLPRGRRGRAAASWTRRAGRVVACVATLGCAAALVGCPGKLSDPGRFTLRTCRIPVESIFLQSCGGSGCHSPPDAEGGLDLITPGAASRMIDAPAVEPNCTDRLLIDTRDIAKSFFLEKIEGTQGACGNAMPPAGFLTKDELACLQEWTLNVVGEGARLGDGGVPADAGASADAGSDAGNDPDGGGPGTP
ncbi:MAG: hypothetical protein KC543_00690 [Myxococcales bacterium]|nr:hypothetical protein [Myxococcales bacterium]